jgi:ABC-type branched-subunit amino acid transport system ATPase component
VLVVGTLTFFPDGLASALWTRRRHRGRNAAAGAVSTREMQSARIAELFLATGSLATPSAERETSELPILEVHDVSKSFGALRAVDGVSLTVAARSLHGLMGPNGAGKTTLFNIVSGFISSDTGRVLLSGAPLDKVPIERRIGLGMARTFQHAAVFQRLTCLDNVIIGLGRNTILQGTTRSIAAALETDANRAERRAALAALEAVGLGARAHDAAGALSLGDQRRLEIARAIVSRPRIILLDEPVAGVSAEEAQRLRELLLAINRELGIAMVVIEHNIGFLHAYFGEREAAA